MNNQLVHADADGTLTTTSDIIAGGVGIQHKNVLETIRKNQADFEEFGRVAFENADPSNRRRSTKDQHRGLES